MIGTAHGGRVRRRVALATRTRSWWLDDEPDLSVLTSSGLAPSGLAPSGLVPSRLAETPLTTPLPAAVLTADVVVVGLGASGLEAIGVLAAGGADVIGLDAHGVAAGAAGANGGFLLAGLANFHHDAVARHGRAAANSWWHRTAEEIVRLSEEEPSVHQVGSLRIAAGEDEERDCLIHLAQMRRDGLDAGTYEGPEGRGLLVQGDGVFHPGARAGRLALLAIAAGARLFAPARVAAVQTGSVTVATSEGPRRVRARHVVVAVDGGIERLVPALAATTRTVRLQMLATKPVRPRRLVRPVYRRFGLDYLQQRPSGEVLLGGGRDVGGEGEWGAPASPTEAVQHHLDTVLAQAGFPTARVSHRWAALAAFTDDRLPIAVKMSHRVSVIGGYSGHGNVIGSLLGRQVARQILTTWH